MNDTAKKNFQLCLVSDQLATGGAERCAALLSNYFVRHGCEVSHVIVVDKIEYNFSGSVFNLGKLKNGSKGLLNRWKRFGALQKFFSDNSFDFIIDFRVKRRQWQEYYIAKCIYNSPLIVTVHSYMTHLYFPKYSFLANSIYSNSFKIITVSQKIESLLQQNYTYTQLQTIYNPVDFEEIEQLSVEEIDETQPYFLAIGRMNDNVKQFDQLIESYAKSNLPEQKVKLILLGDGFLRADYERMIKNLGLENLINFKGQVNNPYAYMSKALSVVLCSKNEGFPTVLIESLACDTPVIAFDCFSGPSEIILNNQNGILVENQNFDELTLSMNRMATDKEFYLHCKQNAKASVSQFSLQIIGEQWMQLFNSK